MEQDNDGDKASDRARLNPNTSDRLATTDDQTCPTIPSTFPLQPAPERNPDQYDFKANSHQEKCSQLATEFFEDSVECARVRDQRQSELEQKLQDPSQTVLQKEQLRSTAGPEEGQHLGALRTEEKPENFTTVKVIGKGPFGEVKLVQERGNGNVYAMKSLKTEIFQKDQLARLRSERDTLADPDSPWVVKLHTTFQDASFLYMLMEFLPTGDLMHMLTKYEILSEDITRFYMAEIILAVDAVHQLGYIHRDIKPDNILLDRDGHVKLTGFGLSTGYHRLLDGSYYQQLLQAHSSPPQDGDSVNIDQIDLTISNRHQINNWRRSRRWMDSTAGTLDYSAPEIIAGQDYSYDCDWWSVGTIMFEFLVGWSPFCAEDRHDTNRKIVNWRQTFHFPDDFTLGADAENLIRSLICNTEDRLGRAGAQEIKDHPFFRGVDFDGHRRTRAPFEPHLTSDTDTTYFPTDEIDPADLAAKLKAEAARMEDWSMNMPFICIRWVHFDSNGRRDPSCGRGAST